jgi:hypothetical protein
MIYLKYNYIDKSYNFNIKLIYDFKTWKNQTSITFVMVCVIITPPHMFFFNMLDLGMFLH